MKIVVLTGGLDFERDVSLVSGALIGEALKEKGHKVALIDMYLGIKKDRPLEEYFISDKFENIDKVNTAPPSLDELKFKKENPNELLGENIIELCKLADIVFLGLHGKIGEDGKLQGLLDLYNIKYTGSKALPSALAMNKHLAKVIMEKEGITIAKSKTYPSNEINIDEILGTIKLPCVVKPIDSGSSVGISIVNTKKELFDAIEIAEKISATIMFEEKIIGREIQVEILGDEFLPPIEIIPKNNFFDYEAKYQSNAAEEICPALLTSEEIKIVQDSALKIFKALGLSNYSRIDFILTETGEAYCLEANTLPGMTPTSLFPQEAKAYGISYVELCDKIVHLALNSYK